MTWRVAILAFTIMLAGATAPLIRDAVGGRDGYRVMGVVMAALIVTGVAQRLRRHPPRADRHRRARAGQPARPAADRGRRPRLPAAADDVRAPGAGDRLHAGRRRLPRHRRARAEGRGDDPVRLLRRAGAAADPGLGARSARGSARSAGTSLASLVLAAGARWPCSRSRRRPVVLYAAMFLVGVGYAGCQVFPMAMLPDAAAVDARRTGSNRAGVYTGVWTAGETLGLALGPGVFALVLALGGYRSSTSGDVAQPDSALTAIVLGFSLLPALLTLVSLVWLTRYSLDAEEVDRMTDALDPAARDAGRRPAGARRPDARLRLRLRPARRRPDRPRGGGGVRRLERPRPDRVPVPAGDGERPGRLRLRPARRAADGGRHRDLRRHRVGAARGAGRARQPARRRAADDGGAVDRARRVPQGRALLRRRAGGGAGRPGLPRRCRGDGGRDRRRAPCWWSPRRRRTRTASSTRCRRSPPRPPRAGCAATSTPASAAGCCRTPPGWARRAAVDVRGRRASPRSRSTLHKYAYAPKGTSLLLHRTPELRRPQYFASADWPGYTMLNSTMQSTKSGGPLAGAWAVVQSLGDDGLPAADPRRVRGGRPDRGGCRRTSRASRSPYRRTRRWWRWSPTGPATRSRSATR